MDSSKRLGPGLKFKLNSDNDVIEEKSPELPKPFQPDFSENEFKMYPGYPKHIVSLNYAPALVGAKFTYAGLPFTYSSTSLAGVAVLYRFFPTPNVFVDADFSNYSMSTVRGVTENITITEGTVGVENLNIRGGYCFTGANFFRKFCPGLDLGYDTFAVLGFKDNSSLELKKVSGIVYGPSFFLQTPLISSVLFEGRVGYLIGSGSGGSAELAAKKNTLLYMQGAFVIPHSEKRSWQLGALYTSRTSTLEGTKGSNKDTWENLAESLYFRFGYNIEF
jgi:hypothetical protein